MTEQDPASARDQRWRRLPNFVTRRVAGQTVVVPVMTSASAGPDTGTRLDFVVLNESAEQLWKLLLQARSVRELARELMTLYEVDEESAAADCESFIASLREVGAVAVTE